MISILNIFFMDTKVVKNKSQHPLLDVFWLLIDKEEKSRVRGLKQLLVQVSNAQKHYQAKRESPKSKPDNVEQTKSPLDNYLKYITRHEQYSPELDYTLSRLVRGLGTSEESTRLSFSTALTEVCWIFSPFRFLTEFFIYYYLFCRFSNVIRI